MKPFICLITGPAGVGKSTIAELLVKEFAKTARIDVDYIRHMIRAGKVRPFPYTEEAEKQILLATQNACDLARNFNDSGFSVAIDDVVVSKEKLDAYISQTKGYRFFAFLLMCDKDLLKKRDQTRPKEAQMGARSLQLFDEFSNRLNETRWHKIDTIRQSEKETLKEILDVINETGDGL